MLIDCDTCTVRGAGCDDCVVTVLLGVPPGRGAAEPTVVPLPRRPRGAVTLVAGHTTADQAGNADPVPVPATGTGDDWGAGVDAPGRVVAGSDLSRVDKAGGGVRPVVELDEVEHRAVRALADFGLVPPLRHQDALSAGGLGRPAEDRDVS